MRKEKRITITSRETGALYKMYHNFETFEIIDNEITITFFNGTEQKHYFNTKQCIVKIETIRNYI